MKKLLILLLSALSLTAVAQQNKVAVYVTGEQSGISKVLGDQLVAAFAKSGKYTAIERTASFLAELNREHAYERTGAVDDNQIARLGVQLGVNYVCVAEMTDAFGEKYISARLIDVETAEVVNTHNVSGQMNSMNTCVQMAGEIATNLSKGSFAEQENARLVSIRAQGYVDLDLPSGTLWATNNQTKLYSYSQAKSAFGKNLPTLEQWNELKEYCRWIWKEYGYKIIGKNGESIFLPAEGFHAGGPTIYGQRETGSYWSATPLGEEKAWDFYFTLDEINVSNSHRFYGRSIRLVKK